MKGTGRGVPTGGRGAGAERGITAGQCRPGRTQPSTNLQIPAPPRPAGSGLQPSGPSRLRSPPHSATPRLGRRGGAVGLWGAPRGWGVRVGRGGPGGAGAARGLRGLRAGPRGRWLQSAASGEGARWEWAVRPARLGAAWRGTARHSDPRGGAIPRLTPLPACHARHASESRACTASTACTASVRCGPGVLPRPPPGVGGARRRAGRAGRGARVKQVKRVQHVLVKVALSVCLVCDVWPATSGVDK